TNEKDQPCNHSQKEHAIYSCSRHASSIRRGRYHQPSQNCISNHQWRRCSTDIHHPSITTVLNCWSCSPLTTCYQKTPHSTRIRLASPGTAQDTSGNVIHDILFQRPNPHTRNDASHDHPLHWPP